MFKKILPISKQNSEYSLSRPTNAWGNAQAIGASPFQNISSAVRWPGGHCPSRGGWVGEGPEKEGGHFLPNSTTSYTSRLSLNGHSPRFRFICFQGHQMKIEAAFCPHTTSFSFQPQRGHSPRIDILVHRIDFKFMREKKTLLPHASTSDGRRCDPFSHTCCLASVASRVWFN